MIDRAQLEITASAHHSSVFFKCPIGGFASLSPGLCPKCYEPLTPVAATAPTSEQVKKQDVRDAGADSAGNEEASTV